LFPCLLLRIYFHSAQAPYTHVGTGLQDTDAPGQAYVLIRARLTISVGRNVARRPGCNKTFEGKTKGRNRGGKTFSSPFPCLAVAAEVFADATLICQPKSFRPTLGRVIKLL